MKLVGREILSDYSMRHVEVRGQVQAWVADVLAATWNRPQDIKARYASASFLSDKRVVFNIKGNKYRLLVKVSYKSQIVFIMNIGTHEEYTKWSL